ncbi:MAG: DUF502 domain-containing protein [Planctomycetota bacterium]|jgi:uncharacterized membrane protein
MDKISRHLTRCFLAGIVALLPIGGTVLSVAYVESTLAESTLKTLPFYFPGLGILAAVVLIYLIGLAVSTFVGKWAWARVDALLDRLPALGRLYQTLKQILGYGEGRDAVFLGVVLVPGRDGVGEELGLLTNEVVAEGGAKKCVVFVPGAPSPTAGRMLIINDDLVRRLDMPVNEALKALLSVGKVDMQGVVKCA